MAKYDIGELITELNDATNKMNNLRVKYDDLEKERDALRAALGEVRSLVIGANHSETRYPKARAALGEKE